MNTERDIEIERQVDLGVGSYFEVRAKYDAEHGFDATETSTTEIPSGDYENPPFVARTPEEQAEQDEINARGKALGEAALRQMREQRGDE